MRITLFLILVACLHVSARTKGQAITLDYHDAPLEKVLGDLRNQSHYQFVYTSSQLQAASTVSIHVRNAMLGDILPILFEGQPFSYTIVDKIIVVQSRPESVLLQEQYGNIIVKGTIKNEDNHPVAGATVRIKGSNIVAISDVDGHFTITVPSNIDHPVIQITAVNIESFEEPIGGRTDMNLTVHSSSKTLEDVTVSVNTGYQTISKERSTGSYSKPDMEIVKQRSTSMNLLQRLDGLVPGLVINNATNSNFYPVMIRGLTSINASSQPLYVVDGIPVDNFNQVNPNDVEDITVLKDATASSIWGARAANGVIVVTTKRGKARDGKVKVDYDAFVSLQGKPDIDVFPTMNSVQYIKAVQEIYDTPGYIRAGATDWNTIMTPGITNGGQSSVLPHDFLLYGQPTWIPPFYEGKTLADLASLSNVQQMKDLWYRNGSLSNNTVSVSGASGKYRVYASLSYTGNKDPYIGDKNNTYQLNARQDYQFSDRLSAYLITNISDNETRALRGIRPDNRFVPYASFLDANGQTQDMSWVYRNDSLRNAYQNASNGLPDLGKLDLGYNPSTDLNSGYTTNKNMYTRIFAGASLKIWDGLRFEGTYGGILSNNQSKAYDDVTGYQGQVELAEMTVTSPALKAYVPTSGGKYKVGNGQQRNWTVRNQLAYDNSWDGKKHQLTALAGIEQQQQTYSYIATTVRGYDLDLLTYKTIDYGTTSLGIANTIINTNATYKINDNYAESYTDTRYRSYYGNLAYTFDSKYTLNASSRIDKSNLFGKDIAAQAKPVWAVGTSWLASNESFLSPSHWLNRLLVRLTYGITGNSPDPGSGGSYDILGSGTAFGVSKGVVTPIEIETPGNSKLSWEKTQNINAGIDFGIFNNRLSGSLDYYFKHTSNLLGAVPQNAFTGYAYVYGNAGAINNEGIELHLNSLNINTRDFSWASQLNLAYNKGKVKELYTEAPLVYANSIIQRVRALYFKPEMVGLVKGAQPFSLYAYRYVGLDDRGDPQIRLKDGSVTKAPGVAKIEDLVNMGSTQPLLTGGLSNSFQYHQFTLMANVIYNFDFVLRRDVNQFYTGHLTASSFTDGNLMTSFNDRWRQAGDESKTDIPAYDPAADRTSRTDLTYYTAADINVIKGDYIKLRDLTLAYQLPPAFSRKIGAVDISVRAQLNNVMLWKANKYGIDPEFYNGVGDGSLPYVGGLRTVPYNQHSVTFGLHATF